jgi:hypothetical protein
MSQTPPEHGNRKKGNFILLYGVNELNAYLTERQATVVYPLLLTLHRHLDMAEKRGETEVALTPAVWGDAGLPSTMKRTRETVLAHLRSMPELVLIREDRTPYFRYRIAKGPAWRRMEAEAEAGRKDRKA